jgi:hypothetical protein
MIAPPRRGDRIPAGIGQKVLEALKRLRFQAVWPLVYDEEANVLYYDGPLDEIDYIKITGPPADSSARYPWVQVFPDPAGTGAFVNGRAFGTVSPMNDPAKELNANANLWSGSPFIVECWRDSQKFLWFRASNCPLPP